jgi:hypothetical protein
VAESWKAPGVAHHRPAPLTQGSGAVPAALADQRGRIDPLPRPGPR